eukprot:m.143383 g.143383  ORF g.143383 m.143383 type:complete len:121 (+) comp38384_c0_seq31:98-460(+)
MDVSDSTDEGSVQKPAENENGESLNLNLKSQLLADRVGRNPRRNGRVPHNEKDSPFPGPPPEDLGRQPLPEPTEAQSPDPGDKCMLGKSFSVCLRVEGFALDRGPAVSSPHHINTNIVLN